MLKKLWKQRAVKMFKFINFIKKITFKIDDEESQNIKCYNPLILMLFARMAFKAWDRFSKIN